MTRIRIPTLTPRSYQLPFFAALDDGIKRAWLCWHRRAGKDEVCMHATSKRMVIEVGNYWHCLPEYGQARKALWEAVNPKTGIRRIDEVFPREYRKKTREDEMFIELQNGSTWRLVGSDNFNSLVGAGPRGVVFSEYALSNPSAWDYIRPMILESNGWAIFNSTVRGRNHFWALGEYAKTDKTWYYSNLTADDTDVFTKEQLDAEMREMCSVNGDNEGAARFRQEYYNDPDVSIPGAYYASQLQRMERDGQIGSVTYDPRHPVIVSFDLGHHDSTVMWFAQGIAGQVRVIDYYESSGATIDHYMKVMREKPYAYSLMILPHDAENASMTGDSVAKVMKNNGFNRQRILTPIPVDDARINTVRNFLPRCFIDAQKCKRGLDALRSYHKEWDDRLKDWKARPKHDWSSHASDAFLHLAIGFKEEGEETRHTRRASMTAQSDYAMFG